jgi:hypothetical protein
MEIGMPFGSECLNMLNASRTAGNNSSSGLIGRKGRNNEW